jgi:polygalacturonase
MRATTKILFLIYAIDCIFFLGEMNAQTKIPLDLYKKAAFKMNPIKAPKFPANKVNITQFGAVGDGIFDNSKTIAEAIDAMSKKGGGTVLIPKGIWHTGPIVLKNNINLHLEYGALLLFSTDKSKYPIVKTSFEGLDTRRCQSPISGYNLENIAITGQGVIDGNGDAWRFVKKEKMTDRQWKKLVESGGVVDEKGTTWYPSEGFMKGRLKSVDQNVPVIINEEEWEEIRDYLRPVLLSFVKCKNVLLDGVTFQNSPAWNIHPLMCENVILSGLTVRNPWYSQNGDGLDLESCKNAVIYKCSFDVGDDAICIKSGKNEDGRRRGIPCENVIVSECVVYHAHGGFVVGSEMSGGVRNFDVSNCLFIGSDVGLRFKSTRGRGGVVENIHIRDINMINIPQEAILFDLYYGGKSASESEGDDLSDAQNKLVLVSIETPSFKDIYISNITCNGAKRAMYFNGLPEMNLQNINVSNSTFTTTSGADLRESNGVKLSNLVINVKSGPTVHLHNVKNAVLEKVTSAKTNGAILKASGKNSSNIEIKNSGFTKENMNSTVGDGVLIFK